MNSTNVQGREIKFRAWDKVAKTWFRDGDGFSIDWDASHITDDNDDRTRTNPTIVLMQFTGLRDKSGKEIYEYDKLQDSSGNVWIVYWYADHACFGWYSEKLEHVRSEIIDNLNTTVIGNLFEPATEGLVVSEGLIDHGV